MQNLRNHTDNIFCRACLWSWSKIQNFLEQKYGVKTLYSVLSFFCSYFTKHEVCHGVIEHYGDSLITAVVKRYYSAEYVCTLNWMCWFEHYVDLSPDTFAKNLLKDKPVILSKNETSLISELDMKGGESANDTLKVLHVTDVHTDFMYTEV